MHKYFVGWCAELEGLIKEEESHARTGKGYCGAKDPAYKHVWFAGYLAGLSEMHGFAAKVIEKKPDDYNSYIMRGDLLREYDRVYQHWWNTAFSVRDKGDHEAFEFFMGRQAGVVWVMAQAERICR